MLKDEQKLEVLDAQGKVLTDAKITQNRLQLLDAEGRLLTAMIVEAVDAGGSPIPGAGVVQKQVRTIKCDSEGCKNEIAFDPSPAAAQLVIAANPWMNTVKVVTTGDGRNLCYCSDECVVKAATSGVLNMPTKKVIDIATGANAMKAAVQQAEMQKASDAALKQGPRG